MERHAAAVNASLEAMQKRCREAGMNVTPQRLAIYAALLKATDHPTPETLFRKVRRAMPSLSLATVYKALAALESLGLVAAIGVDSQSRRYDANMNRHHHLVCRECRSVTDFYDQSLDRIRPKKRLTGFVTESISVNVSGLCADCRKH